MAMGQAIRVESGHRPAGGRSLAGRLSRPVERRGADARDGPARKGKDGTSATTKSARPKARTAEDLDAELDAFMKGGDEQRAVSTNSAELKVAEGSGDGMVID